MSGLIPTGENYKNMAMSGFIRQSEEEQKIQKSNAQIAEAQKQQTMSTVTSAAGAAISVAMLVAELC